MTAAGLLILFNLFILESLLSIDNAAVLAVMVKDLPGKEKTRALRYGMLGAYLFRGICLVLAAFLVKIMWLKIAGGLYLLWLAYGHFTKANDTIEEASSTQESKIFAWARKIGLNKFWATVVLVEVMDLAFSIDNIFAAVALTDNIYLIMAGVAIGIAAMRFIAGKFVILMEKYPSMEKSAYIVIFLLGAKLVVSGLGEYGVLPAIKQAMESHYFDFSFSAIMILIFISPILLRHKHA